MDKKLVTVSEAASLMNLGRSLVYSMIMSGELHSITCGRARRVPVSAIDDFIERKLAEAAAQ